ncbi:MAG: N-formylglutamate amidohydrolase [Cohaesibacter sp.]|nr:N-formylglutamate amidohydrolase [Cohaesibacter sp.]
MDFAPKTAIDEIFTLSQHGPQAAPFLFNSPHSGRAYSQEFRQSSRLDAHQLRKSEDAFIDLLFSDIPKMGVPLLSANFPRAFLDLNREPYELDPRMFDEPLPPFAKGYTARTGSGLGTIARIVSENQEIYHSKLKISDALKRIETYYKPYHQALRHRLARIHVQFGYACLVDCHSMPSRIFNHLPLTQKPDIILGDRYGISCHRDLTQAAFEILSSLGFKVALNKPYAGGFITQHYGRPNKGLHALQIELNRGLYMDEDSMEPLAHFDELRDTLSQFAQDLLQSSHHMFRPTKAAAE